MRAHPVVKLLALASLVLASLYLLEADAWARAGGGGSMGSRGSRSFSSPSRPPSTSAPPSQPLTQPQAAPTPQPAPAGGGFFRGLAGGVLGGLLGGMLFSSLGFGGFGGGFGLIELLVLVGIGYLVFTFLRRKQEAATAEGYQRSSVGYYGPQLGERSAPQQGAIFRDTEVERGLEHVRQMDPAFQEKAFEDLSTDNFFKIQAAWMNRDLSSVRGLLTTEMLEIFQKDVDQMRAEGRSNRLENIAVRSAEITEAWQEQGQDYVTVHFLANLLDYTTDEAGRVISGSKIEPVKFEEYWTWTRPVGPGPWRLTAINQAA